MESQSLKEKVVKGSIIVFFMALVGSLFAYLIRVLFSRSLTIENYGLFYAALSLFGIAITYIDLGFGYSIVYLLPKYIKAKEYSKAWNVCVHGLAVALAMSGATSIVLILFAPFLARNLLKVEGSENIIYIFCIYLISATLLNGLSQIYTGLQKEKYYSIINVFKWLLILVFSLLFLLFNTPNVVIFAIAWSLAHVVTAGIFVYLLYRRHPFFTNNKIIWQNKTLKVMWVFALPALLESAIYSLTIATDTSFLALLKGVKEAGIYNIIYPIASISIMLLNPLNNLILPLVSHLMEGEKDKLTYLINRILEMIPFVGLYFALFVILFPSAIIALIFGAKWSSLAEGPLMIMSVGSIGLLLSIFLGTILIGMGKIRERLRVFAFIGIFHVIFNAVFIFKFGVWGAVITNSILGVLLCAFFLKTIREVISFNIPYFFYLRLLIFSSILYLAVRFVGLNPHSLIEFIFSGIIYSMIFMFIGFILNVYDRKLLALIVSGKSSKL